MNILLSNDDGYKSPGLKVLKNVLEEYGKVTTAAPHRDISASSSCLSVHKPVQIKKISKSFYKIYGTPADCVHIASRGIMKKLPDIVFSGVNIGSNMGDDVVYSGTVGAAIEGSFRGVLSIAISQCYNSTTMGKKSIYDFARKHAPDICLKLYHSFFDSFFYFFFMSSSI